MARLVLAEPFKDENCTHDALDLLIAHTYRLAIRPQLSSLRHPRYIAETLTPPPFPHF